MISGLSQPLLRERFSVAVSKAAENAIPEHLPGLDHRDAETLTALCDHDVLIVTPDCREEFGSIDRRMKRTG